jgi:hypothetical protein
MSPSSASATVNLPDDELTGVALVHTISADSQGTGGSKEGEGRGNKESRLEQHGVWSKGEDK